MSFLRVLRPPAPQPGAVDGWEAQRSQEQSTMAETEAVRRIVGRLEALPPEQARLLAATAYVLARAAYADLEISDAETAAMEHELTTNQGLDAAQAVLVVEMAKLQERTTGETSDYLVTREYTELTTVDQRMAMLRACYRICVADDSLSGMEAATLTQIAGELGLDREQAATVRAEFADKLSARHGF